MNITKTAVCKHCGKNIHKRNEVQGWLHAGEYKECRPTYAEPKE